MDESIQLKIQEHYMALRPSEKKAADCILNYRGKYEHLLITDISKRAGVSQPTIIRFVKALGYQGFREFKNELIKTQAMEESRGQADGGQAKSGEMPMLYGFKIKPEDELSRIPGKVIATSVQMLKDTLKTISEKDYEGAVKAIIRAKRVVIYGVEDSAAPACDLMIKLMYLGISCVRYEDYYLQHVSTIGLTKEDLAIGISYSGCSRLTVEMMQKAKKAGAATLVITNFENALINRYGDYVLCSSSRQFMYGNAIFSRITQLAIVDMLYMGVLNDNYDAYSKNLKKNSLMVAEQAYDPEHYLTEEKG